MFESLKITIDGKVYTLATDDGQHWWVYWVYQQRALSNFSAHDLDYWRKKGVIVNEAKKEAQG